MKAIVAKSGSDAQDAGAFILKEQPIPEPGTQDLLVRVIAIGMNPVDPKFRKRSDEDGVLGWDAYGIVEKTGEGVTGFKAGDKVFYAGDISCYIVWSCQALKINFDFLPIYFAE